MTVHHATERGAEIDPHEHRWVYRWVFHRTAADWWDGEYVYKCAVDGCTATDVRYIPR